MSLKPEFLIVTAPSSGVASVVDSIQTAFSLQDINKEPSVCDRFNKFLQPKVNETGFGYDEKYAEALEFLSSSDNPSDSNTVWCPDFFIEHPAIQWAILNNLSTAKILFVLRNPTDAIYLRYLEKIDTAKLSFEKAITLCKEEMESIGSWSYRGKWERFYAAPSAEALLLEGGAYGTAVSRCNKILGKSNIHVTGYENFLKNPDNEISRIGKFLNVENAAPGVSSDILISKDPLVNKPLPSQKCQDMLDDYFAEQINLLQKQSEFDPSLWVTDAAKSEPRLSVSA